MDSYIFFIKTQSVVKSLELTEAEILSDDCCGIFFTKVYSAFGLNTEDEIDVKLYTKDKYLIPPRQLPKLLLQFKLCSNFMIDVFFPTGAITTMSHEILEQYLKNNECTYLFTYHEIRGFLSNACKKELYKQMTNFIVTTYSINPKEDEIVAVCLAAIKLFPSLEVKPSSIGGIDIFYDGAKECGKIFECLKYRQRKVRDQKRAVMDDENMSPSNIDDSVLNIDIEELKEYLDSCVLPRDIRKIEEKMRDTIDLRRGMLESSGNRLPKMFNFYWVDPNLILYDFTIMYPDITASALLDVWKEIELKPAEKFKIELKDNAPIFNKDLDVHRFFLFIKMLPCHRIKFESAVKSLMVFSEDPNADPAIIRDKKNVSPHFVFIAHEEEKKFYISACDRIINVPSNFTFIQALDMFFKVHKVFHIPFHKHLLQVMSFFGGFVYRMDDDINSLTPKSLSFSSIFDE